MDQFVQVYFKFCSNGIFLEREREEKASKINGTEATPFT